jgi:PII-like signaling protein
VEVVVVLPEKHQQEAVVVVVAEARPEALHHHLPVVVEVVDLLVETLVVQNYQLWVTNNQLVYHQKACRLTLATYQNI